MKKTVNNTHNLDTVNPMEKENVKVPKGMIIAGQNVYFSKDCYATGLNNNVLVCGTSGSGKTRYIVKPNILQAEGSYVISDPKGNLHNQCKAYLEGKGYEVKKVNFIHPETSLKFNPLAFCKTTQDIQKLAHALTYANEKVDSRKDPFWDEVTELLLSALIAYIVEADDAELPKEEKNFLFLSRLIEEARKTPGCRETRLDRRMEAHEDYVACKSQKESWAAKRYHDYKTIDGAEKTHATILICCMSKLSTFDTEEVRLMLSGNDIDFTELGKKKVALFVEVSDSDRSMDMLVNLFYTCLMNQLCTYADENCKDSRLSVPVQFILDDFATNAKIDNFENMVSNIRSRNISAMIMVQSEAQLKAGYGDSANTIIDNCNTYIFLGNNNPEMAKTIAQRADRTVQTIQSMPVGYQWVFRRGQAPVFCKSFDLDWFMKEKGLTKPAKTRKRAGKEEQKEQE